MLPFPLIPMKKRFVAYLHSHMGLLCSCCLDCKLVHLFYPEMSAQHHIFLRQYMIKAGIIISGIMRA